MAAVNSITVDIERFCLASDSTAGFTNVHTKFEGGKISILLGTSGRGKTTFLRVLLGTAQDSKDARIVYLASGSALTPFQIQKTGRVGIVSQDAALVPWLTTQQNLELPTKLNRALERPQSFEIEQAMCDVGLERKVLGKLPHELSFGMRQRVAFIRALLYVPAFLLLDETFSGLDPTNISRMARMLEEYVRATRAVCILVTHNIAQASRIGDCVYYLSRSRNLERQASHTIDDLEARFAADIA